MGVNGIYGLSGSGMDIESLVKVGMMSKQNEYDKMAQKYTKNEWTKSAYLELSSTITTFNSSTLSQYKMSSNMNAKTAESSNPTIVKASAGSSAAAMNHNVTVKSLSSNAYLISTTKLPRASTAASSNSTKLADVLFSDIVKETGSDGKTYVRGHIAKAQNGPNEKDELGYDKGTSYTFGKNVVQDRVAYDTTNSNAYLQKWDSATNKWVNATSSDTKPTDPGNPTNINSTTWNGKWSSDPNSVSSLSYVYDNDTGLYWDSTTLTSYKTTSDYTSWKAKKDDWDDFKNSADNSTKWRMVVNRDVSTIDITDKNSPAFKFTISDGKNSGTISYTFDDLINGEKTLTGLANDINALGLNIRADYDVDRDQFTLYNKESGKGNKIEITLDEDPKGSTVARGSLAARNFFTNLGFYQSENGVLKGDNGSTATEGDGKTLVFKTGDTKAAAKGYDNEVVIDGVTYKEGSNKVTVGGVTYTANNVGSSIVSINQDTDAIIDKVKSFVADYNKLLSSLYEKYDEKADSNYKPLTQSQKDGMKEEQITKWEEKAKQGLLYHDQTLGKIIQNMRNAVNDSIELDNGKTISIYSLGISTTGLKGQLVLDEDKLKKALAEDPDAVYNVFAKIDKNDIDDYDKMGVAQRLGDVFAGKNGAIASIKSRAGSTADITEDSDLNNLLRQLQTRMSNFKKLMSTFEDALYKKYDKMESTLAKLGAQLSYIMGGNS